MRSTQCNSGVYSRCIWLICRNFSTHVVYRSLQAQFPHTISVLCYFHFVVIFPLSARPLPCNVHRTQFVWWSLSETRQLYTATPYKCLPSIFSRAISTNLYTGVTLVLYRCGIFSTIFISRVFFLRNFSYLGLFHIYDALSQRNSAFSVIFLQIFFFLF